MEKKVEIMPRMRDLKKGKKVEFPIDKVCTVRNNVSKGIVTVFRDS